MRAEEARCTPFLRRIVEQADDRKHHDAKEDEQDEEILEEEHDRPGPDNREPEVLDIDLGDGLDHGDAEHKEAPEGEDVRDAGDSPLQQLLLSQHLGALEFGALAHVAGPAHGRLTGADHALEEEDAAGREDGRHHDDGRAEHDPDDVEGLHGGRLLPASSKRRERRQPEDVDGAGCLMDSGVGSSAWSPARLSST